MIERGYQMTRYTSKTILSMEFGMSSSDMEDYRYHYGRTNKPVYAIGNEYYCAVKIGQKPAKHKEDISWNWKEYSSSFAEHKGFQIWVAK
jgi:hypothetical protein